MRLPSIRQTIQEALATLRRFPIVIAVAAIGAAAAIVLVDYEGRATATVLFPILLSSILGIPLLIALALLAERRGLARMPALGLQLAGVVLLAGYALTVPTDLTHAPLVTLFRFFILAVALHLFVAFAPFMGKGEVSGFWQYNKNLMIRLITAAVYSGVLYAGLAIALAALDNLFGVEVPGRRYFQLWIIIAGIFNTWFFLAGAPENVASLETVTDYPKTLKVFAQYILFPIALVYLVILYAYLGKIVFAWDWPQGWVSKLILGFSGTGLFTLLLLHPLSGRPEGGWVKRAAQLFFIILVPLIVMLFLAVWRRVSEYGITEGRYLAIAVGVWLAFLVVYFLLSKARSIKVIPVSLCVAALVVSFGPWGVFSVARESQIGRLETLASKAGILADGKIRKDHAAVPVPDAREISAILAYLHENHGFDGIQKWFPESLTDSSIASGVASKNPEAVANMMGVQFVSTWWEAPEGYFTFNAEGAFNVAGYDHAVPVPTFGPANEDWDLPGANVVFRTTEMNEAIVFTSSATGKELLRVDILRHVGELAKVHETLGTDRIPSETMAITDSVNGFRVKVCPWQIRTHRQEGKARVTWINAVIVYSGSTEP